MGCLASRSRRVTMPPPGAQPPTLHVPTPVGTAMAVRCASNKTSPSAMAGLRGAAPTGSKKPHQLNKSASLGSSSSGSRRSTGHQKGLLSSVRSSLSVRRNSSVRSANSNRSNRSSRSVRESFGVSTGGDSVKDLKFDAMLEPDAGSSHTLVDSAFRAKGYRWIIDQVERKTAAALDVHKSYMGDELHHEVKLFHGGEVVDAVRNRNVTTNADVFAKCLWDTLTTTVTTPTWRVQSLEDVDASTCYTQVVVVDGISPGHPLVMNVLLKRIHDTPDRHVLVMRSVAEDAKFPLPHQSIAFSVSGWVVLDRTAAPTTRRLGFGQRLLQATHARSLFRCRATRDMSEPSEPGSHHADAHVATDDDHDPDQDAAILSDWLMDAIVRIFHAIESSMIQRLSAADIKPNKR